VNEFIARALGERVAKVSRKKDRSKKGFQSTKERFVVFLQRLPSSRPRKRGSFARGWKPIWNAVKDA